MTTKTPPSGRRRASRTADKARGSKRRVYSDAERAAAVTLLREEGMAAAHDATSIPKGTLGRWARAEGIDLEGAARERTAAAAAATAERHAKARLGTVERLEQHVERAASYLTNVLEANAEAADLIQALDPDLIKITASIAGPVATLDDEQANDAGKRALAMAGLPLSVRDAEGVLTRAIHDLQLLKGEATERGELVVDFAVPRPVAIPDDEVPTYDTQEN